MTSTLNPLYSRMATFTERIQSQPPTVLCGHLYGWFFGPNYGCDELNRQQLRELGGDGSS